MVSLIARLLASSREPTGGSEPINAGFFDFHSTFVFDGTDFAVFNQLVNDLAADAHVPGCFTDRHQWQCNIFFSINNHEMLLHITFLPLRHLDAKFLFRTDRTFAVRATLLSDYNAFRFGYKGGYAIRVASCGIRIAGYVLRVSVCRLRVAGINGIGLKAQGIGGYGRNLNAEVGKREIKRSVPGSMVTLNPER